MDQRSGEIMEREALKDRMGQEAFDRHAVPVDPVALSSRRKRQLQRTGATKVGRNEPCPCGSGAKFKRCCYQRLNSPPGKSLVDSITDGAVELYQANRRAEQEKAKLLSMKAQAGKEE